MLFRSPITGWTVAVGLPREFVDAPLRRAQWLAFGGGGTALAASLALAWWMARAIRRPVEALTAAARALGSGAPLGPAVGGVRELDQVNDALRATAAALEGISRNPGAAARIQTPMILGLALIESLVLFALVIAFLLQSKIV